MISIDRPGQVDLERRMPRNVYTLQTPEILGKLFHALKSNKSKSPGIRNKGKVVRGSWSQACDKGAVSRCRTNGLGVQV